MKRTKKTITVKIDESTHRWLKALASANCQQELTPWSVTIAELLAQAAFCFADAAGRRHGSWEADVGRNMLLASGYQKDLTFILAEKLRAKDEAENAAHRKTVRA